MLKIHSIQSCRKFTDPNIFLTLNSQDTISLLIDEAKSSRAINFNEPIRSCTSACIQEKKNSETGRKSSRKIGKSSVKKLGTTLFNLFHVQKQPQNKKIGIEFLSIKQQIKKGSNKVLKSKHKVTHSQLLEARSIQLDEELKQLHTKRQNEKIEKNSKISNVIQDQVQEIKITQSNRLASVPQFFSYQSTKNLERKLENHNKTGLRQKEKNGFYTKLKLKLKKEMQKIEAKKKQTKENFLVQGCKLLKFDPQILITRKPLTDRPRPQSSLTRTGLLFQTSQITDKDRRPKTSRSRTVERKEIEYMSATADEILDRKPKSRSRTGNGNLARKGEYNYQSTMNKTLKHVSPLHLIENQSVCKNEVKNEKIKEKMLTLLVDCDNQTNQYCELSSGLRVFQSFTNRMNKGLSEVSKMLSDAQYMSDSYAQFMEK